MISYDNRNQNLPAEKPSRLSIFARSAAALSLAGTMTLGTLLGVGGVSAQTASAGTVAASIVPATAAMYFGFSLDTESAQWVLANELLQRAGATQDVNGLIDDASSSMSESSDGSIDTSTIFGGEAAIAVTDLSAIADDASGVASDVESADSSGITSILGNIALPGADGVKAPGAGFALIINPSDLAAATKTFDDDINATASDLDVQVTSTDHNGTVIKSVAGDADFGETGTAYAVVGDFLVVSETPKDIVPFIDTADGTTPALSSVATFGQADTALAGDRLGFGYIDGASLVTGLGSLDTSGLGIGNAASGLFGGGGVTGLSVIADPAGFRLNTVEIPSDGVDFQPGGAAADLTFADKVPANTLIFVDGFGLGQGALLQSLGMVLVSAFNSVANPSDGGGATPVAMPSLDELYQQTAMLIGFNLKTDFIDQMVGEYGFALWNVNLDDPSQISALLTSNVAQPATLTDSVSKLSLLIQAAGQGKVNVTTRIVNDANVSSVDIQSDGATVATLEYGVVDGQFMLGVGGGIDQYLAGNKESLSHNAAYEAALAALPAEYDGIFFVNAADAVALGTSAMGSTSDLGDFVDASSDCAAYTTQASAQEAYDADNVENFSLDQDFDGQACEDYFVTPAAASPVAEAIGPGDYSAVQAFATVSYKKDGLAYTNSILLIAK